MPTTSLELSGCDSAVLARMRRLCGSALLRFASLPASAGSSATSRVAPVSLLSLLSLSETHGGSPPAVKLRWSGARTFSSGTADGSGTTGIDTLWNRLSAVGSEELPKLPSGYSYFEIYGIDPTFSIDVKQLDERWKQLQNMLHPDKFAVRPQLEQEEAAELSRVVNLGRSTLRPPLSRAKYILKLKGFDLADDELNLQASQEFLIEVSGLLASLS